MPLVSCFSIITSTSRWLTVFTDYQDIQMRDPEDRADGMTIGVGRAILSNRISHFLNIKGASMTIDTACSGSLVSVDVACRYLQTGQISGAIIAAANLYLCPEQNQDMGAMRAASSFSGKCHTFDAKADGYCKAEGINAVVLKRLDDAIRDGDPIRAVIRGSATNSDGWTSGIASPNGDAQTVAMRAAISAAGISDLNDIGYLECHGTGTLAGDPEEVHAAASVFSPARSIDEPLIIGSIKSNIGHSENAAGISGLLKAIMAVEKGTIPGNPTFVDPNPKIDFRKLKVKATQKAIPWPEWTRNRIACVNSFGYGGSNAHVVLQDAETFLESQESNYVSSLVNTNDLFADDDEVALIRPQLLVFSANDEHSLKSTFTELQRHLKNPEISVDLADLAYTLSERRSRLFSRGFLVTKTTSLNESQLVLGKKALDTPRIGLVFTGQGAQWPMMGKGMIETFPWVKSVLARLDTALQQLPIPPSWSLLSELTEARSAEHLRQPEFSQPLVTALQLVMLEVLTVWCIQPASVVGHSSGEIAAACASGFLTYEDAIKIAFYRGQAAKELEHESECAVGMMAVGLGSDKVRDYIGESSYAVQVACFNSPNSVTLSGKVEELEKVRARLQADSHFARLLQVNLAYHSKYMSRIGEHYEKLLRQNCGAGLRGSERTTMFSSVHGGKMIGPADAAYWRTNMVSPVRFDEACTSMLTSKAADFLIEVGPSGALAGPIGQIKKALPGQGQNVQYFAAAKRGPDSASLLFDCAGRLFLSGGRVDLAAVNKQDGPAPLPRTIVDLPNYAWNRQKKYWYESDASREWRYRPFVHHDLLGSKVLNAPWHAPTYRKILDVKDLPWLIDHKMGPDIVFPAAAFCAMAIEAIFQSRMMTQPVKGLTRVDQFRYHLRNLNFEKALVLDEQQPAKMTLSLSPQPGPKNSWHDFKVTSYRNDATSDHCHGLIRIEGLPVEQAASADLEPLRYPTKASLWYKALAAQGYGFGPCFVKHIQTESVTGERRSRSDVDLTEPPSKWNPQSLYAMHPAPLDGCFQTVTPSAVAGIRSSIRGVLVPAVIDDLVINPMLTRPAVGRTVTTSTYTGKGRLDQNKSYMSGCSVFDPESGALLIKLAGLRYNKLDTNADAHAAHNYNRLTWKPDVTFLSQVTLPRILVDSERTKTHQIIDLIAHKKPTLNIMEANMSNKDTSSLWLSAGESGVRASYNSYSAVSSDANAVINLQEEYSARRATSFDFMDLTNPDLEHTKTTFDLLIVKRYTFPLDILSTVVQTAKKFLMPKGYLLLIEQGLPNEEGTPVVNGHSPLDDAGISSVVFSQGFQSPLRIPCSSVQTAYLAQNDETEEETTDKTLSLVRLAHSNHFLSSITLGLRELGWQISEHSLALEHLQPKSTVLILDELSAPLLKDVTAEQWTAIKQLMKLGSKVLWVTSQSQLEVSSPNLAMVHGLFRTIRAEDISLSLTTLDVESVNSTSTIDTIGQILERLREPAPKTRIESEYVERSGTIHVSRIMPDEAVNRLKSEELDGAELQLRSLHDSPTAVRLQAERLGTLDSLQYCELSKFELPIGVDCIEVEIYAAGLNFKDVAVTMGIVPEDEYLLGVEGSGVVRRIGQGVANFNIGDRVVVFEKGCFGNRVQLTEERAHKIPDTMSFEEAATIMGVYLTSLYCLFNLGNLRKGQTVLIHSAAGGIGISSIQLAKYKGADIFVTVGTEEKKHFLHKDYGIPYERMFSSRTTQFASEIMAATNNKGVDMILNSLTGDLLDESWRICADGGIMVEIGKKDVLDRNRLSMEPFDRNCSFRALDFSHKSITDELIANLMRQLFELLDTGHIQPIRPIKVFPFEEIPSAFAFMRTGRHIGKIVITNGPDAQLIVPIRPAVRKLVLRGDASYVIVGGLRGLCGSLAVHLAANGAKHIIAVSRSGCSDERSQGIIRNCNNLGAQVYDGKADVSHYDDVLQVFQDARFSIRGVIQGAMVLRDRPYELMTVEDYHTTTSNKVQGTWNLHKAAMAVKADLDFMTLLSSLSGVVGQKGQANYAAANVFLDAFSTYRRSAGLPCTSVNLGVIEDVGYVAEQGGMDSHFDKDQWTGINERVLHKILEYSIWHQDPAQRISSRNSGAQLITGIAYPMPADADISRDARFGPLFVADDASGGRASAANDAQKDIQAFFVLLRSGADATTLLAPCVDVINTRFTKMLRLSEPLEPAKSLSSYGLDSLSAVEFRNWLRVEMGAELSTLEVTNASSLFALAEKVIARLVATTR